MIQRGHAAQVGRGRVHGHRSEREYIHNGVVGEEGKDVCRKVEHHQVRGIFFPNQPASEQCESACMNRTR